MGGADRGQIWARRLEGAACLLMVALVGVGSLAVWSMTERAFAVCVATDEVPPHLEKMAAALDKAIELGLTLSVTLVGLGAAILMGMKSGLQLTRWHKLCVFIAVLFFGQSGLYSFWWRLGVAQSWLNRCVDLVVEDMLQIRFTAAFVYFMAGLATLMLMLVPTVFSAPAAGGVQIEEET